MTDTPQPIERLAPEHGWVRRPDKDGATYDAWELPDGRLHAAPKGETPKLVTLDKLPGLRP